MRNTLILGCGRSGTSIFGELFESLPGFTYFSEPLISEIASVVVDHPIAVKVPRETPGVVAPIGSSIDVNDLFAVCEGPFVVFWQVRHPLDAVCSLRIGIEQNWGHHPRPPDWLAWQARPLIERCAHHWAVINESGYAQVRQHALVNRFEDMITDPLACAIRAVQAVGVNPDEVTEALATWARRVQDTNNENFVEAQTSRRHSRADHRHKVNRWRENLSPDEVETILPLVADAAATFGYELPAY